MHSSDISYQTAFHSLMENLRRHIASYHDEELAMIGIHTGGVWVARALQKNLNPDIPLGNLDISFYRDDFSHIGINPQVKPSEILFDVGGRHIILVDDVLYTGRTIRAALNEIFDYGRPTSITLAVLIERDGRQLPIAADYVGQRITLASNQQIKLSGPSPLTLELIQTS